MRRFAMTSLLAIMVTFFGMAQISGTWQGKLNLGMQSMRINFNFDEPEPGDYECTMDSPDQGAFGIPAAIDNLAGDSVAVRIAKLGLTYNGRVSGDSIVGVFKQMTFTTPLTLYKKAPRKVVSEPAEDATYETVELAFCNPTDGVSLCGTFTLPEGYKAGDKVKAVVMVNGSGQQNRDDELFGHKPMAVIADFLARNGIASFRYDDRGVGCSGGDPIEVTLQSNLADAMAALAMLRDMPETSAVGILGHSEGGLIGYMAAVEEDRPDFVISLAGPAVKGEDILVYQNRRMLEKSGAAPASFIDSFEKALRGVLNLPEGADEKAVDAIAAESGMMPLPDITNSLKDILRPEMTWVRSFAKYDPKAALSELEIPVFLLNGEKDTQVPGLENVEAFRENAGSDKAMAKIYPGLNHLFQHCETGELSEYADIEETIAPEVLAEIAEWIKGL